MSNKLFSFIIEFIGEHLFGIDRNGTEKKRNCLQF